MVKKLFLLFCIISLNSVILAAEFTASVDRDKIGLHETTNCDAEHGVGVGGGSPL